LLQSDSTTYCQEKIVTSAVNGVVWILHKGMQIMENIVVSGSNEHGEDVFIKT